MGVVVGWCGVIISLLILGAGCSDNTKCGDGTALLEGECVGSSGLVCAEGTLENEGECVPDGSVICQTGTRYDRSTGKCRPDISGCATGTILLDGMCVPEDSGLRADVLEAPEPNGFGAGALPGGFSLPDEGQSITLEGCVLPFRDENADGLLDPDLDVFIFQTVGPVVVNVTVDGVNGLAGAFGIIAATDGLLRDAQWQRLGLSFVSDTVQRRVFIPSAGSYALILSDSRSIQFNEAVGGQYACYYATLAVEAPPEPNVATSSTVGALGDPIFVEWTQFQDDSALRIALDGLGTATQGGAVIVVNDELRLSFSADSPAAPTLRRLHDLDTGDKVMVVVETVYDTSLTGLSFGLELDELVPVPHSADGTLVQVEHDADEPLNLISFEAQAGDMVRLELAPPTGPYQILLYPPSATDLARDQIAVVCEQCGEADLWVRAQETGTYFLQVQNYLGKDGQSYPLALRRTHRTPQPLEAGVPVVADLSDGDDYAFFLLDAASAPDWIDLNATATTGTVDLPIAVFFDGAAQGALDQYVLADQGNVAAGMGRILLGDERSYLVAVFDDAAHGDEVISVEIAARPFTTAIVDDLNDLALLDTELGSKSEAYYLVVVPPQSQANITVGAVRAMDPELAVLDPLGDVPVASSNVGGYEVVETLQSFRSSNRLPLRVRNSEPTGAGQYDLLVSTQTQYPALVSSTPLSVIVDNDLAGISDIITIDECAEITGVLVDIEVSHSFVGDLELVLEGPDGTVVQLKAPNPGDPSDDVRGTYGDSLATVGSLAAFAGLLGTGEWILRVRDVALGDEGQLDTWTLRLFCF